MESNLLPVLLFQPVLRQYTLKNIHAFPKTYQNNFLTLLREFSCTYHPNLFYSSAPALKEAPFQIHSTTTISFIYQEFSHLYDGIEHFTLTNKSFSVVVS